MLPLIKFDLITTAINHLLEQEDWAQQAMAIHVNKVVCFDIGLNKLSWQVGVNNLLKRAPPHAIANVIISVSISDILLTTTDYSRLFSHVKIKGDADFANSISQISRGLRWDFEKDLSNIVGDIAAVRIVTTGKSIISNILSSHKKIAKNIAEYLVEEQPTLVRPREVSQFSNNTNRLHEDLQKIAQEIDKLRVSWH